MASPGAARSPRPSSRSSQMLVVVVGIVAIGLIAGAAALFFGPVSGTGLNSDSTANANKSRRDRHRTNDSLYADDELGNSAGTNRSNSTGLVGNGAGNRDGNGNGSDGGNPDGGLNGNGNGGGSDPGTGGTGNGGVHVESGDASGADGNGGRSGLHGSTGAGTRHGSSGDRGPGRTWRIDDGNDIGPLENPDEDEPVLTEWTVLVTDGTNPVTAAVGLFQPATPLEIRIDGLYGAGSPMAVNGYSTDDTGRLTLPHEEAVQLAGGEGATVLGVYIDMLQFEPVVALVPLNAASTTIVLRPANFVEIEVRRAVTQEALPGAEVELWRYEGATPDEEPMDILNLVTDSIGRIASRIMPGRNYAFRVRKSGYSTTPVERFTCDSRDVHYVKLLAPGNFLGGTVFTPEGAPLPGATVNVQVQGNGGWGSDTATTDSYGQFLVTAVPHSDYTSYVWVTISASGYATLVDQTLTNNESAEFTMSRDAAVTGTVMPPVGEELLLPVRVVATAQLFGQPHTFDPFEVNPDGTFALSGLTEGQVTLVAENDYGQASEPVTINYTPGSAAEVVLQLLAASQVEVSTVSAVSGLAIPDLTVAIGSWRGITDAAGMVFFGDIRPAELTISIEPPTPGESLVMGGDGNVYFVPAPITITSASGEVAAVTFSLTPWEPPVTTTEFTINFRGDPAITTSGNAKVTTTYESAGVEVVNVAVAFQGGVGPLPITARSDAQTLVEFTHPDYEPATVTPQQLQAEVEAGATSMDVFLVRTNAFTLQTVDRGGSIVFGVGVQVLHNGNQIRNGQTDGAGRITFTNLPSANLQIVAFKHGYRRADYTVEIPVISFFEPQEKPDGSRIEVLDLGAGSSAAPPLLQLTISDAGDIHLTVTHQNGTPGVGAKVWVMRSAPPTQPLDFFDLGEVDAQGQKVVRFHWDVEYQVVILTDNEIAFHHFFNDPESPVYFFELTLEPKMTISGQVLDASGQPQRGQEVRVVPTDGPLVGSGNFFATRSNGKGNWSISVPAHGTYTAMLQFVQGSVDVEGVIPGQTDVIVYTSG